MAPWINVGKDASGNLWRRFAVQLDELAEFGFLRSVRCCYQEKAELRMGDEPRNWYAEYAGVGERPSPKSL